MQSFILTPHTPLRVIGTPSLPLKGALRDMEKDWYKVFSYPLLRLTEISGENEDCEIVLDCEGTLLPEKYRPTARESYTILHSGRRLILAGADVRGQIYAVYRFSREVLGVDPLWYFNDFLPERRERIELPARFRIQEGSPAFRYRGWFINDEDILNGFFPNYTNDGVMSLDGFNHIMEALLRMGGNMIVPGSFAMPDEQVRRLAAARGVVLNDHHVTPLGLNMYRWPEDVPFSYSRGKDYLHACWQTCVDTLKDYEQVWTVSFRGKNDHPYWQEDAYAPADDEGRAREIGEAINTQISLIRKADPDAVICFNMYHEQSAFYKRGLIDIPKDVIRVWPGAGCFDPAAAVRTGPGDGVYYHLTGAARNRYTEHRSPEEVFRDLSAYYNAGATAFCLFNVSNIRHLAMSMAAGMDYLWNAHKYARMTPAGAAGAWQRRYLASHYGEGLLKPMQNLYRRFFGCIYFKRLSADFGPTCRSGWGYSTSIFSPDWIFMADQKLTAAMQGLSRALIAAETAGIPADMVADAEDFLPYLEQARNELGALVCQAEELSLDMPARAKKLFLTQVLTQLRVLKCGNEGMLCLCQAVRAYASSKALAAASTKAALEAVESLCDALHLAEYGKWSTWYETERFACVFFTRDIIDNACRALEGAPQRPMRYVGGYRNWLYFWDKLYEYQHGCNFPLLK